jgi:glycine/D-amino acid oxidase-like deaminating enzyme
MRGDACDTAIVGAGSVGIAVAYSLAVEQGVPRLVLIDAGDPMGLTSAQSGENYRNWWPHPTMTAFTDHAIDRLEAIARATGNRIGMTRRGYALATRRAAPAELIEDLHRGYGENAASRLRVHGPGRAASYRPAASGDWETAPDGVDILSGRDLVRAQFPSFAPDIATVIHIRRAGDISGQQLGQFMLEAIRARGGRLVRGRVVAIERGTGFTLQVEGTDGRTALRADRVVDAAGPFLGPVAALLGETLPVHNVYQQKIAFEDRAAAIPRTMPFAIDLDGQTLAWSAEDRAVLAADPDSARLVAPMPGGVHCRPEGGAGGRWVKMGWAYNEAASDPAEAPPLDPAFPDIVLRAASRLNPSLRAYVGRLPRGARHYGGHYTMTPENWPLIGRLATQGAFVAGALSGFGTMAACAAGALCAAWVAGAALPAYAAALSPDRSADGALMAELGAANRGIL